MKKITTFLTVLLISSAGFSAEECFSWTTKPAISVANLKCTVAPTKQHKSFEISVLDRGACVFNGLKTISEIGRIQTTSNGPLQTLSILNENGFEILSLDISGHLKNSTKFFFRLSFPVTNSTAIFECEARNASILR